MIQVWQITEQPGYFLENITLSEEEKSYYSSLRNETRKKLWLCCRHMIQEIYGRSARIGYDTFGKPWLKGMDNFLGITHSGEMVAVILSVKDPVGIDIEKIRARIERVKDKFLSPEELKDLGSMNRLEKLHVLWGAKESLYKIHGRPDIEFQRDILIESFDYLCSGLGQCRGRMMTPEGESSFDIFYQKISDHLLVYAMKNGIR